MEWICYEDAAQALQGKKTYDTWQEGLLQVFEAVMENKPFIMNVYHSLSREQIESYLFRLTHDLIMGVVNENHRVCSSPIQIKISSRTSINIVLWESCWIGSNRG